MANASERENTLLASPVTPKNTGAAAKPKVKLQ
jgi:hypothetical protein